MAQPVDLLPGFLLRGHRLSPAGAAAGCRSRWVRAGDLASGGRIGTESAHHDLLTSWVEVTARDARFCRRPMLPHADTYGAILSHRGRRDKRGGEGQNRGNRPVSDVTRSQPVSMVRHGVLPLPFSRAHGDSRSAL